MASQRYQFGQYLKWGVDCVAAHQPNWPEGRRKQMTKIDAMEMLGRRLKVSPHTIERWCRGHIPTDTMWVETLGQTCVELGGMDRVWLRNLLQFGGHPEVKKAIERILPTGPTHTYFLDDAVTPRHEIFDQARKYLTGAERYVYVLNSHPREPGLKAVRDELEVGELTNRIAAAEKILSQHTFYEDIIERAKEMRGEHFEYIHLVQNQGGVITPENTGYHYLRHFYRMTLAKDPEHPESLTGHPDVQVFLYQSEPVRQTTFVLVDGHTLLQQVTGVRPNGPSELRGLQIIQDGRPDGDPARWGRLHRRLRLGAEGPGTTVQRSDLEGIEEARRPLGEMIAPQLTELIRGIISAINENQLDRSSLTRLLDRVVNQVDVEPSLVSIVESLIIDKELAEILMNTFNGSLEHPNLAVWWRDNIGRYE